MLFVSAITAAPAIDSRSIQLAAEPEFTSGRRLISEVAAPEVDCLSLFWPTSTVGDINGRLDGASVVRRAYDGRRRLYWSGSNAAAAAAAAAAAL